MKGELFIKAFNQSYNKEKLLCEIAESDNPEILGYNILIENDEIETVEKNDIIELLRFNIIVSLNLKYEMLDESRLYVYENKHYIEYCEYPKLYICVEDTYEFKQYTELKNLFNYNSCLVEKLILEYNVYHGHEERKEAILLEQKKYLDKKANELQQEMNDVFEREQDFEKRHGELTPDCYSDHPTISRYYDFYKHYKKKCDYINDRVKRINWLMEVSRIKEAEPIEEITEQENPKWWRFWRSK